MVRTVMGVIGLAAVLCIAGCPGVCPAPLEPDPIPQAALKAATFVAEDGSVAVEPDISGSVGKQWALKWALNGQVVSQQGNLPAGVLPLIKGLPRAGTLTLTNTVTGWGASDHSLLVVDLATAAGHSPPAPPAPPGGEGWWMPYGIVITIDGDGNVVNVGDGSADGGYFIYPPYEDGGNDGGNGGVTPPPPTLDLVWGYGDAGQTPLSGAAIVQSGENVTFWVMNLVGSEMVHVTGLAVTVELFGPDGFEWSGPLFGASFFAPFPGGTSLVPPGQYALSATVTKDGQPVALAPLVFSLFPPNP